jgi:hypothetical protein
MSDERSFDRWAVDVDVSGRALPPPMAGYAMNIKGT